MQLNEASKTKWYVPGDMHDYICINVEWYKVNYLISQNFMLYLFTTDLSNNYFNFK